MSIMAWKLPTSVGPFGVPNAGSRSCDLRSAAFFCAPPGAQKENGGVREDPAIPARALLPTDQGRPHGKYIGASIHWNGRARGDEPARTPQWHSGQYEALTNLRVNLATSHRAQRRDRTNAYMCHWDHLL
jgi:hypothetical protein